MDGAAVIAAYHDLWRVEQSFRMTKGDLRARPVFHHQREAIEAHLTVVFAALAVARHLQDATGTSIKKLVQALRTARSATIEINGQRLTLDPDLPDAARDILKRLETGSPLSGWHESGQSLAGDRGWRSAVGRGGRWDAVTGSGLVRPRRRAGRWRLRAGWPIGARGASLRAGGW